MTIKLQATRLLKTSALVILLAGCKKSDWVTPITIGSKFNYDEPKILQKPDGNIPVNPFTVDSVATGVYSGNNGYWVSSSNKLVYLMEPVAIRKGMIK